MWRKSVFWRCSSSIFFIFYFQRPQFTNADLAVFHKDILCLRLRSSQCCLVCPEAVSQREGSLTSFAWSLLLEWKLCCQSCFVVWWKIMMPVRIRHLAASSALVFSIWIGVNAFSKKTPFSCQSCQFGFIERGETPLAPPRPSDLHVGRSLIAAALSLMREVTKEFQKSAASCDVFHSVSSFVWGGSASNERFIVCNEAYGAGRQSDPQSVPAGCLVSKVFPCSNQGYCTR